MKLIIGNKNYSSWSLRSWILLSYFEQHFSEHKITLFTDDMKAKMNNYCPNYKVPVLIVEQHQIWDSLAICEYLNEEKLENKAWPSLPLVRAKARSICAEMHSGFNAMRHEMPMNCRRNKGSIVLTDAAQNDIKRIISIFSDCLSTSNGPFLFGNFSIADAFYLPVVIRFDIYNISVPVIIRTYMDQMIALPAYQRWLNAAKDEAEVIECEEV